MGLLDKHQKTNIRFQNKDLIFYEPTENQLKEIKEIIEDSVQRNNEFKITQELDIKSTRYIIREMTNIGAEIDEYTNEELITKLDNGDRVLKLLLREVQKFVNEMIDDIFEEKIEQTKSINTLINISNSTHDIKALEVKINKFFKKNKINMKFEDFINIYKNPEIIQELNKKLNIVTK